MSTKKQKERKKKVREIIAKKRVLARRNSLRKQTGDEKKLSKLNKKFRDKVNPIIKDEEKRKMMEDLKNQKILSKLEKNAEILKALEKNYEDELNRKKEMNSELEAEGYVTLQEKVKAMGKKAIEGLDEKQQETGEIDLSEKKD
jgi:hypothetical protein